MVYFIFCPTPPQIIASDVKFVKVDVQGFEELVLRGAVAFLRAHVSHVRLEAEFAPRMIRMRGGDPMAMLHFMHELGYRFKVEPAGFEKFIAGIGDWQTDIDYMPKKWQ